MRSQSDHKTGDRLILRGITPPAPTHHLTLPQPPMGRSHSADRTPNTRHYPQSPRRASSHARIATTITRSEVIDEKRHTNKHSAASDHVAILVRPVEPSSHALTSIRVDTAGKSGAQPAERKQPTPTSPSAGTHFRIITTPPTHTPMSEVPIAIPSDRRPSRTERKRPEARKPRIIKDPEAAEETAKKIIRDIQNATRPLSPKECMIFGLVALITATASASTNHAFFERFIKKVCKLEGISDEVVWGLCIPFGKLPQFALSFRSAILRFTGAWRGISNTTAKGFKQDLKQNYRDILITMGSIFGTALISQETPELQRWAQQLMNITDPNTDESWRYLLATGSACRSTSALAVNGSSLNDYRNQQREGAVDEDTAKFKELHDEGLTKEEIDEATAEEIAKEQEYKKLYERRLTLMVVNTLQRAREALKETDQDEFIRRVDQSEILTHLAPLMVPEEKPISCCQRRQQPRTEEERRLTVNSFDIPNTRYVDKLNNFIQSSIALVDEKKRHEEKLAENKPAETKSVSFTQEMPGRKSWIIGTIASIMNFKTGIQVPSMFSSFFTLPTNDIIELIPKLVSVGLLTGFGFGLIFGFCSIYVNAILNTLSIYNLYKNYSSIYASYPGWQKIILLIIAICGIGFGGVNAATAQTFPFTNATISGAEWLNFNWINTILTGISYTGLGIMAIHGLLNDARNRWNQHLVKNALNAIKRGETLKDHLDNVKPDDWKTVLLLLRKSMDSAITSQINSFCSLPVNETENVITEETQQDLNTTFGFTGMGLFSTSGAIRNPNHQEPMVKVPSRSFDGLP